jgi:ribose transport system ATP-binding protein
MVEIAKALSRLAKVLVMDEPTAVLTKTETAVLFEQVEALRAEGAAILFTSHKLDEVRLIADRVTILRDGDVVPQGPTADMSEDQMAEAMVGRDVSQLYPPKGSVPQDADVVLKVKNLTVPGYSTDISLICMRAKFLACLG